MTKTELKKKSKDELIDIINTLENSLDFYNRWAIHITEEDWKNYEEKREEEVRHDVCKKIKIYAKTELKENLYISEILFFNYLDKIERGE